jgi:hypothetical protein
LFLIYIPEDISGSRLNAGAEGFVFIAARFISEGKNNLNGERSGLSALSQYCVSARKKNYIREAILVNNYRLTEAGFRVWVVLIASSLIAVLVGFIIGIRF